MAAKTPAPELRIEHLPPGSLIPNPKNARRHSPKQIAKLAASINALGFNGTVVIDETGMILCGHARHAAAIQLKIEKIPCIRLTHLTAEQKTAFALADNKLGDLSSFDADALQAQLAELVGIDFSVELIGFDTGEVDVLLDSSLLTIGSADADDDFEPPESKTSAVSRIGDLWIADAHRLHCNDALLKTSYEVALGGEPAQMVFTDPPYNLRIGGHVSGLGAVKHREFAMASGEMSESEFRTFLLTALGHCTAHSLDGSIHFVCMDWSHIGLLLEAGRAAYSELKNICVWNKTNAGMGSLYRSQHEMIAVFKHGKAPHQNNVKLGRHGRYRTNVWTYAGANGFGKSRKADLDAHPTVKPVGLVADAIRDCSKRRALILDPFAGSGTILIAAERTGRRAAAIELDPLYVDTAIRRWQRMTGKAALLAGDGRSFHEIEQDRRGAGGEDRR